MSIEPVTRITDAVIRSADLCITYGMPDEFVFPHKLLIQPAVFPVCSPSYLDRAGKCGDVKSLLSRELIHVDDGEWWRIWLRASGVDVDIKAATAHTSNDIALTIAEQGAGIALATHLLVSEQLKTGQLLKAIDVSISIEFCQAVTPSSDIHPDVKWIIDWIERSLSIQ
ncbi:LysR substrate-binding domain-containing protein [Pseudomonas sp. LB3P14]